MPECLEAHLGKFPKLVPAIALACELCDHQDGTISGQSLDKAIRWAEYLEAHARRIYSSVMNSEIVAALRANIGETFSSYVISVEGGEIL